MASVGQTKFEQRLLDDDDNKAQDIESWIAENNLDQSMLTALKKSDVNSVNDLYFLRTQDVEGFAKELGLKTIQRRKFEIALTSLLQRNPNQPPAFLQQQPMINNYNQAPAFNNVQPQQPMYNYSPYQYPNDACQECCISFCCPDQRHNNPNQIRVKPLYPNQPRNLY